MRPLSFPARFARLAAVATVASGCLAATALPSSLTVARPPEHAAPGTFRIVAFGSSSTEGVGASGPSKTYPSQVEAILHAKGPVEVVNEGVRGDDIDAMGKRLQRDVIALHPDLVIWQVGSNDAFSHVPLDRFEKELREDVTAMRESGAEVMLMEPQWCPDFAKLSGAHAYVDAVRRVGEGMHLTVVPRYELMLDWIGHGHAPKDIVGPDGLHMTDEGYRLLAGSVADIVRARSVSYRKRFAS